MSLEQKVFGKPGAVHKVFPKPHPESTFMVRYALSLFLLLLGVSLNAASFDCAKARSVPEMLICNTPHLSVADESLLPIYKAAEARIANWPGRYESGQSAADWFKSNGRLAWRWREENCRDVLCLEIWLAERRALLKWISESEDGLGDYGFRQLVTLPDRKILLSYGMATHIRNVVFDPETESFTRIRNGDAEVIIDRTAPILLRQFKGYFEKGGAYWVPRSIVKCNT